MDTALIQLSQQLIEDGEKLVEEENFSEAKKKFEQSVSIYPSAQGLTYWGWMESYEGNTERAIDLCKKAIAINPNFGNAYNDIGCYHILLKNYEEAETWLEKAKHAPEYDFRYFPYLNLGRLYIRLGQIEKAVQEFKDALTYDPHNTEARFIIHHFSKPTYLLGGYFQTGLNSNTAEEEHYVSVFSKN